MPAAAAGGGAFPPAGGLAGTGAITGTAGGVAPGGNLSNPAPGLLPEPPPVMGGAGGCRHSTVAFVIDGSGSMCEPFGMSTRWNELRVALLDKTRGLIYKLQATANFGLYLYDGSIDTALLMSSPASMMGSGCSSLGSLRRIGATGCDQIVEVRAAANNAAMIDSRYPAAELGGSTPTDRAMNFTIDRLIMQRPANYSPEMDPQFIILATDGAPNDICTGGAGGDGLLQQANVVAAVDRAQQAGITTFVISLASDPALQAHLDMVAKHGDPKDPTARTYTPTNSEELVMTLTKVLGSALGCLF